MKYKFCLYLTATLMGISLVSAEPLKVVATLPTFADIAKQVGGEHVDVSSIASPRFNPHFIEPKPTDVLKVKRADLFIHAGLDLEPWRGPLVDAAGNTAVRTGGDRELDISVGLMLLEVRDGAFSRAEGDIHIFGNPHYWLNPENGRVMARLIASKLAEIDPAHTANYESNLEKFASAIDSKISDWRKDTTAKNLELIGYHNEWIYLTNFLDLKMRNFLEPKPGIPPTPGQIASLRSLIDSGKIAAVVQASFNSNNAARTLTSGTAVPVITLCQQVYELESCSDYLTMLDYNIKQIREAIVR